jgi:hypothetical protein
MQNATHIICRMYNGVAVRLGHSEFVTARPPLFSGPQGISPYSTAALLLRVPALLASPAVNAYKAFQRSGGPVPPERMLYFPFSITPESLPLQTEEVKYDFTLNGSTVGVWLMRDAYAPFQHTFANLYGDRKRLLNLIVQFEGDPFRVYDWRKLPDPRPPQSWADYIRTTRQSRYVIATGGFHNAGLPKHLEYACLGTPMIGRRLPFEYPWLDECLFDVDLAMMTPEKIRPLLDEAIARQPVLQENCLKWRERLFKLHDIHRLFDVVQMQIDRQPIPEGYVRPEIQKLRPV